MNAAANICFIVSGGPATPVGVACGRSRGCIGRDQRRFRDCVGCSRRKRNGRTLASTSFSMSSPTVQARPIRPRISRDRPLTGLRRQNALLSNRYSGPADHVGESRTIPSRPHPTRHLLRPEIRCAVDHRGSRSNRQRCRIRISAIPRLDLPLTMTRLRDRGPKWWRHLFMTWAQIGYDERQRCYDNQAVRRNFPRSCSASRCCSV